MATLSGEALSTSELAGFLKPLSANAGSPGRIACKDVDMAMALKKQGISLDPRASAAWATTTEQVKTYLGEGKFVICPDPKLLEEGASLAIVRRQGHPVLLLHAKNAKTSGVQLSDNLMKIAQLVN